MLIPLMERHVGLSTQLLNRSGAALSHTDSNPVKRFFTHYTNTVISKGVYQKFKPEGSKDDSYPLDVERVLEICPPPVVITQEQKIANNHKNSNIIKFKFKKATYRKGKKDKRG